MKLKGVAPDRVRESTGNELFDELLRLSDDMTEAIADLEKAGVEYATKDNEMRKAKAKAFLQATGKNATEREANADAGFSEQRLQANLAEAKNVACLEKVRGLRAQLSAFQTLVAARRAEVEGVGYGQIHRT